MTWLKLQFHHLAPDAAESLEDALLTVGAQAVTLEDAADQPLFEPDVGTTPLWSQSVLTALFPADTDLPGVIADLTAMLPLPNLAHLPEWRHDILEDKDWVRAWMDHYHPMQFGQRLWICPSWQSPPDPGAVNLLLDPGLAFGTGTHPSTALCMRWLNDTDLTDTRVVDYGCGSGILGIAALLLGARYMMGVDIDPQAVTATRMNADHNAIDEGRYDVYLPDAAPPLIDADGETGADVVLANILAGPLIDLRDRIVGHLKPNGWLVMSGVIKSQVDEVVAAYTPLLTEIAVTYEDEWARIAGRRIQ